MHGIIWCKDKSKGKEKFKELIEGYRWEFSVNDIRTTTSRGKDAVYFNNGDYWELFQITELSRRKRCNISLIDKDISEELVDSVIKPSTTAPPFNAYSYF